MARYDADWVRTHYDEYGMREWDRWGESPVEPSELHVCPTGCVPEAGRFTCRPARTTHGIAAADLSSADAFPRRSVGVAATSRDARRAARGADPSRRSCRPAAST